MRDVVAFNKLQAKGNRHVYKSCKHFGSLDDNLVCLLAVKLLKCALPLSVGEVDGSQQNNIPEMCAFLFVCSLFNIIVVSPASQGS